VTRSKLTHEPANTKVAPNNKIIVIGAGAAGSSAAQRLTAHGFDVDVIEREKAPAQGASGNLAGVFRPLPSLGDTSLSRLLRACFLYGRQHIAALSGVRYDLTGVLHLARDEKHEESQRRVILQQHPPPDFCRYVNQQEASELAGWPVERGGWWFAGGGWLTPPSLCQANLSGIRTRFGIPVERMARVGNRWQLFDEAGHLVAEAPQVVLANGVDTPHFAPQLPIRSGRGVVSHLPEAQMPPFPIVATRNGYVTPAVDGFHCAGATLSTQDADPAPRLDDHLENLLRLDAILPDVGKHLDPAQLGGRIGFRPMSPDRHPIVGPLSASDGLWVINGFGARGLVWASLCAELLACQIKGIPLPLEPDLVAAVSPERFATGRFVYRKHDHVKCEK